MRLRRALGPFVVALVGVACQTGGATAPSSLADRIHLAARICAKTASCSHAHDAPRERDPAACVDAWMARAPAQADPFDACVLAARGCAAVDACARDRADTTTTAFCGAHPGTRTGCDGHRLVTCSQDDPSESSAVDCAAFGATCGDLPQSGGLMSRGCISPTLCPPGAPEMRCDGAAAMVTCREGATERTACTGGARCEEHKANDGTSSALCESPDHRHCDAVGKRWCEKGRLVACLPHGPFGQAAVTDCAALGLACDEHAESGAACVAPGPRTCETSAPRCEAGQLTFCAAGRRFHVDCGELGLGACDPDAHGVDAACSPVSPAATPLPAVP